MKPRVRLQLITGRNSGGEAMFAGRLSYRKHERYISGALPDATDDDIEQRGVHAMLDFLKVPCHVECFMQPGKLRTWLQARGFGQTMTSRQGHTLEWYWVVREPNDPVISKLETMMASNSNAARSN